jgi:PleD family two-component response regulator
LEASFYIIILWLNIKDRGFWCLRKGQFEETQALKDAVQRDELTHIYNRQYLEFHLKQVLNEAIEFDHLFGILFIDVDHFKNVESPMAITLVMKY